MGSLCRQQRVTANTLCVIQFTHDALTLFIIHEMVGHIIACCLLKRGEEREDWVDGGMIEELVLRVIDLSDIRRRLVQSATNTDNHQGNHQ